MIFALGILAILSIISVGYVTVVRIDRGSAAAVVRQANYQQQVNAVLGHIKSLVAADLFGNKIADRNTPRNAWPRPFEDGEFWDYPTIDEPIPGGGYTFDTSNLDNDASSNARITLEGPSLLNGYFPPARPDDAWLASSEPAWQSQQPNDNDETFWPQITILRSGWRYNDNGNPSQQANDFWERSDGRFADLGRFFKDYRTVDGNRFGNPGTDLLARSDTQNSGDGLGVERGTSLVNNGDNTKVYHLQMANMTLPEQEFDPSDERFWVDTDGDLRPDARWTQLDSLGNLYGLVWVTAARIIDASALVNVNTSIDFWDNTAAPQYGDGRTPADVDLIRLMEAHQDNIGIGSYFPQVRTNKVDESYEAHINSGLGFGANFLADITSSQPINPTVTQKNEQRKNRLLELPVIDVEADLAPAYPLPSGAVYTELTANQRAAFYELGALALENPISPYAESYEVRDLRDLMAHWGTNEDRILSRLEQNFDGPVGNGYLPGDGGSATEWGPMRSMETAALSRQWNITNSLKRPSLRQMKFSVRRLLTTVSGTGSASPVPVLNDEIPGRVIREKINLRDLSASRATTDVPRMFEALVWALAPFVTDESLMADMTTGAARPHGVPLPNAKNILLSDMSKVSYGGSVDPAVGAPALLDEAIVSGDSGATHAVFTAASLAANIQDVGDEDDIPTVIRFVRNRLSHDDPNTDQIELGRRLAQGDIPAGIAPESPTPDHLPAAYFGPTGQEITFVGLERQPFITEVVTGAWYSTASVDIPGADNDRFIDGTDRDNQLGSMVVVELFNPWDEAITLGGNEWQFVIPDNPDAIGDETTDLMFSLAGTIDPGTLARFVYYNGNDTPGNAWLDGVPPAEEDFQGALEADYGPASMNLISDQVEADKPVIFMDFTDGTERPMLLLREIDGQRYLMDRLVPDGSAVSPVPSGLQGVANIASASFPPDYFTNIQGPVDSNYFQNVLLYPPAAIDSRFDASVAGDDITGRMSFIGGVRRPSTPKPPADGGFPASLLAFNGQGLSGVARNGSFLQRDVNAWLYPENSLTDGPLYLENIDNALYLVNFDGGADGQEIGTDHRIARSDLGSLTKSSDASIADDAFPGFQLMTPRATSDTDDDGFTALSELHQVSIYAHTCMDNDLLDLTKWTTVSEKLAMARRYDFDQTDPTAPEQLNPYFGVLDPTRYIPSHDIANNTPTPIHSGFDNLPDSLRLPLALRVFDCFDALPRRDSGRGRGDLQMGRININTAPPEVLMLLPFVGPEFNIDDGANVLPAAGVYPESMDRVAAIMAYRGDTESLSAPFNTSFDEPREITGLQHPDSPLGSELREMAAGFTKIRPYGFASIGELATLHQFETPTAGQAIKPEAKDSPAAAFNGFMTLGTDTFHSPGAGAALATDHPFDLSPHSIVDYNPKDDPEERLALFRAISNIATQRSDVFLAWFIVRGYSPDVIEQIPVNGAGDTAIENAMNEEEFRPAYETRWLAVLDRSNVRTPIDRPEVLMLVELPSTSP